MKAVGILWSSTGQTFAGPLGKVDGCRQGLPPLLASALFSSVGCVHVCCSSEQAVLPLSPGGRC